MTAPEAPATLANWRTAPHSRWAFRRVDRLLATASIAAGQARAPDLPVAAALLQPPQVPTPQGPLAWDAFLRRTHTDGLMVLHAGQVVHAWCDEGMAASDRHIVMSATKSVVGLLCGAMAHAGLLDLAAPVARLVPEVADGPYAGATLRQLLDMRAQPLFTPAELQAYASATGWEPAPEGAADTGLHAFLAGLPARAGAHGGPFRYVSANTDLLGWAMERAGGRPFAELVRELLWAPMGAQDDASIALDRAGAPRTTGGLSMSLRDLARIGQLVLDGGGTALPFVADWLRDTLEQGDAQAWSQGDFARAFGRPMHYRSGWYVVRGAQPWLFAMGIHGQHLFVDPAYRLVVAKLSAQPQAQDPQAIGWTLRAVEEWRRLCGP
jgi:hypothetical protein